MAAEWMQSFERTVETCFTADFISGSVKNHLYTFPVVLIALLVLTVLIGWGFMKSRKPYDHDKDLEWILWHWLLALFNSTGFWIVALQLYKVVREEGFSYAVCNNLTTDRPWLSLWTLLHVLCWALSAWTFAVQGVLVKSYGLLYFVFIWTVASLYGWYGFVTTNPVAHWYALFGFVALICVHYSRSLLFTSLKFIHLLSVAGLLVVYVFLPLMLFTVSLLAQHCSDSVQLYSLVGVMAHGSIFVHLMLFGPPRSGIYTP